MYYKIIENGYITVVGIGSSNEQIDAEEYNKLIEIINNRPSDSPDGYVYMLDAETLEYVLVEFSESDEPIEIEVEI